MERFAEDAFDFMEAQAEEAIKQLSGPFTLEEAMPYIEGFNIHALLHNDGQHILRYLVGYMTWRIKSYASKGDAITEKIADAYDISISAVRLYTAAARKTHGNIKLFTRWLRSGKAKMQYDVEAFVSANKDPSVYGPELMAKRSAGKVERASKELDEISDPETKESLNLIMTESAERFRLMAVEKLREWDGHQFDEPPEEFDQMIRHMACPTCGTVPPDEGFSDFYVLNDPHHTETGGTGKKGSEWAKIPQCRHCHGDIEDMSIRGFMEAHGQDPVRIQARIWHIWLTGHDIEFPPMQ